jgi:hypothetical protein
MSIFNYFFQLLDVPLIPTLFLRFIPAIFLPFPEILGVVFNHEASEVANHFTPSFEVRFTPPRYFNLCLSRWLWWRLLLSPEFID